MLRFCIRMSKLKMHYMRVIRYANFISMQIYEILRLKVAKHKLKHILQVTHFECTDVHSPNLKALHTCPKL